MATARPLLPASHQVRIPETITQTLQVKMMDIMMTLTLSNTMKTTYRLTPDLRPSPLQTFGLIFSRRQDFSPRLPLHSNLLQILMQGLFVGLRILLKNWPLQRLLRVDSKQQALMLSLQQIQTQ